MAEAKHSPFAVRSIDINDIVSTVEAKLRRFAFSSHCNSPCMKKMHFIQNARKKCGLSRTKRTQTGKEGSL